ncbi:MAG: NTP transferase domain-containing protein [Candidatus Marinimicrobia bacterium]|nr:NTP transferase domain-containing protein [Candidatus Neomarinimicrobiota bacterium]
MRAVIPAAGVGKRLRPFTYELPKVMISLAGKPLIGHILDHITSSGVTSVSLIVGYMGEQVIEYVRETYPDLRVDFPYQAERRGLGHAVLMGLEEKDEDVLILLGDTIFDVDFRTFIENNQNSIAVVQVDDPRRFGVAEVNSENRVTRLVEKPDDPRSNLALAGLYYIKNQRTLSDAIRSLIENDITTRGEYQLTDALQLMIEQGMDVKAVEINGWYDCGTKDSLLASHKFLLKHSVSPENERNCKLVPPVFIHPTAQVSESTIGPYVTIDGGAIVSGSEIENAIIGKDTVVRNMILSNALLDDQSMSEAEEITPIKKGLGI